MENIKVMENKTSLDLDPHLPPVKYKFAPMFLFKITRQVMRNDKRASNSC